MNFNHIIYYLLFILNFILSLLSCTLIPIAMILRKSTSPLMFTELFLQIILAALFFIVGVNYGTFIPFYITIQMIISLFGFIIAFILLNSIDIYFFITNAAFIICLCSSFLYFLLHFLLLVNYFTNDKIKDNNTNMPLLYWNLKIRNLTVDNIYK